jgi:hypothetical protein
MALLVRDISAPAIVEAAHAQGPRRRRAVGRRLRDRWPAAHYVNTWFPWAWLDIANVAPELTGRYDFLLASGVFEHVVADGPRLRQRAPAAATGVFVFSVPFRRGRR